LQALVFFFFDLCLLRRAPQDLPGSDIVLALVVGVSLIVSTAVAVVGGQPLFASALQGAAQVLLLLAALYLGLSLMRRPARFVQAATALLGAGVVLSVFALIPVGLLPDGSSAETVSFAALALLALFIWSVVVSGHILRHTLGVTLGQGAAIAVLYELFSLMLLGGLAGGS